MPWIPPPPEQQTRLLQLDSAPELQIPGRKPAGPVEIDRSNSIGKKIASAFILNGDAQDLSGRNNGVLAGASLPALVIDKGLRGYNFNQDDTNRIELLNNDFDFSQGISVVFRVKTPSTISGNQMLLAGSNNFPGWLDLYAGRMEWNFTDSSFFNSGTLLSASTHYTIAWVYDGANVKSFVDGVLDATYAETDSVRSSTSLYIGAYDIGNPRLAFDGDIFDVLICEQPLSDPEVASLQQDFYQFLKPAAPVLLPYDPTADSEDGIWLPTPQHEMPELFIPGRKPVGDNLVIDWSHPITEGLVFYALDKQILTGQTLKTNTSGLRVTSSGQGIDADATGAVIVDVDTYTELENPTAGPFSVFTAFYKDGNATQYAAPIARNGFVAAPWLNYAWELNYTGSDQDRAGFYFARAQSPTTSQGRVELDNVIVTGYNTLCAVANSSGVDAYAQGDFGGSTIETMEQQTGTSDDLHLGDGDRDTGSVILVSAIWQRELNAAEIKSLHENPYQFLIPA